MKFAILAIVAFCCVSSCFGEATPFTFNCYDGLNCTGPISETFSGNIGECFVFQGQEYIIRTDSLTASVTPYTDASCTNQSAGTVTFEEGVCQEVSIGWCEIIYSSAFVTVPSIVLSLIAAIVALRA